MDKQKKYLLILLSLSVGLLFWLSWPPFKTPFISFIGLIPILWVEEYFYFQKHKKSLLNVFFYSFLGFLGWNLLTTYWVINSTLYGAIAMFIMNTLVMTLPIVLYHWTKIKTQQNSYVILVVYWLAYEYIHLNWDLSWTWLNLGNLFASCTQWIQWYEFTGTMGGTLWVLLANIFIFKSIKNYIKNEKKHITLKKMIIDPIWVVLIISLPIIISLNITKDNDLELKENAVIIQPNIDPYNTKFNVPSEQQIQKIIRISEKAIDSNTRLLIWPETAIPQSLQENNLNNSYEINEIRKMIQRNPQITLISGMSSFKIFQEGEKLTKTAKKSKKYGWYYEYHNTALMLNNSPKYELYFKSKLVPGVEKMPYPQLFGFLEKFAIDLGGTSGSLGTQKEAEVFKINEKIIAAPIICYESIFGEHVGKFVKLNANYIVIITNDGWWGNTDGHKQHLYYAKLRAIETRRNIARSANTGISAFINSKGEITQKLDWWKEGFLKQTISLNNKITYYSQSGDYLGKTALFLSILLIFMTLIKSFMKKNTIS